MYIRMWSFYTFQYVTMSTYYMKILPYIFMLNSFIYPLCIIGWSLHMYVYIYFLINFW